MRCGICHAPLRVNGYGTKEYRDARGFVVGRRHSPRYSPCPRLGDPDWHFRPTIAHAGSALEEMPDARAVRDVMGYVAIDGFRVAHVNNWGDERFPWHVQGPVGSGGDADLPEARADLESFPRFSEAVAFARRAAKAAWAERRKAVKP